MWQGSRLPRRNSSWIIWAVHTAVNLDFSSPASSPLFWPVQRMEKVHLSSPFRQRVAVLASHRACTPQPHYSWPHCRDTWGWEGSLSTHMPPHPFAPTEDQTPSVPKRHTQCHVGCLWESPALLPPCPVF